MSKKKLSLSVAERVAMTHIYPQSGDMLQQTLVRELSQKIEFTDKEREEFKIRVVPSGGGVGYQWDSQATKGKEKEFDLDDGYISMLKSQVDKLDSEKKITQQILGVCEKIKNL